MRVFCGIIYRLFVIALYFFILSSCEKADDIVKDSPLKPVNVIAHRGYWRFEGAAQNSIAALKNAGELGIYGSEFDVWKTKDDRLVVNHDKLFHELLIVDTIFDDLTKDCLRLDNGEKIPTLEEFLEVAHLYPKLRLVLELKTLGDSEYNKKAVDLVIDSVLKHGSENNIDFISFSYEICKLFAESKVGSGVEYLGGGYTVKELFETGITGINYSYTRIIENPTLVGEANALGMNVTAWTVDNVEDVRRLIEIGIDKITTNNPMHIYELFGI